MGPLILGVGPIKLGVGTPKIRGTNQKNIAIYKSKLPESSKILAINLICKTFLHSFSRTVFFNAGQFYPRNTPKNGGGTPKIRVRCP